MAEAFGVAAGAIGVVSLSIQLAESLHKVKSFYESVKNAPPQVAELIEEIEIMQDILGDLETGSQGASVASTPTMRRCMKVADGATKRFTVFATELQNRIKKSKYRGGIKFLLNRDDIKQMLDQLERTKSSLSLAYSLYQQATAEDRHAALIQAVSSSQGTTVQMAQAVKVSLPTQDMTVLTHGGREISPRRLGPGKTLFRMTTPEWLSNTICQLEVRRSIVGVNIFMRTYGIVPSNAPVFEACESGDIVGMQRLFDSGLASPFDHDERGMSLWETAVYEANIEVIRCLSQYDVGPILGDRLATLLVFHLGSFQRVRSASITALGSSLREDMLRLNDMYEEAIDNGCEEQEQYYGYSEAIRLLSCSKESADSIHFWQCFERPYWMDGLDTFSERYCQDMLSQYVPDHHNGRTPLQFSAINLAYALTGKCFLTRDELNVSRNMEMMIVLIIQSGADVHEAVSGYTPLALFLKAIPATFRFLGSLSKIDDLRPRSLRGVLKVWLNILQSTGVDLTAYGAEESSRVRARYFKEDPLPLPQSWDRYRRIFGDELYYFTFTYGPTPDDWTVQFDMVEEYLSDFWRMPNLLDEPNVQAIPGSWIDT